MVFIFPTQGVTWSLDLRNGQWTEWYGHGDNGFERPRIHSFCYSQDLKKAFAGDFNTANLWELSDQVKTDAGGTFKRKRTFSWRDNGASVRKQSNFVRVNVDRSDGMDAILELRWRDDGKDWVDFRSASLGSTGTKKTFLEFRRLGTYRERQYELQMSDPAPLRITAIETDEDVMVS